MCASRVTRGFLAWGPPRAIGASVPIATRLIPILTQSLVPPNTACLPLNITVNDAGHNTQDGSSRNQIVETWQDTPKPKQCFIPWSRSLFPTTRYQEAMKRTASTDGG